MTNTSGALHTSDDNGSTSNREEQLAVGIFGIIFIIASPLSALAGFVTWVMFSYVKIRRSVIALVAFPLIILAAIFWKFTVGEYVTSWSQVLPSIVSGETNIFAGILTMLGQQAWLGIPVGLLIGLGYSTYRWVTRPRWMEYKFRRTPWEIVKSRKVVTQIRNDENTPMDGVTLGVDDSGERIVQTDKEAVSHTLIIGGAGSGKTTTISMRVRDAIKRGQGVCVIDLKGGDDVPKILAMYAERYDRKFQHWLIQDQTKPYNGPAKNGPAFYDPLAQGDATRRADMVLELRKWDAASDYYRNLSQSYLQLLFNVLIKNPGKNISTLRDAVDLMTPKELQQRAIPLAKDPQMSAIVNSIDKLNDDKISNSVRDNLATNRSVLENYLFSTAGPWLDIDHKNGNDISLLNAAQNGDIVLFSLDSSSYPQLSASLANLIIQDLKTVSAELRKNPAPNPFQVIIDEFAAIGSDNIIGLINKSRDAQMPTTLATQTLGDLIVANPAVKDQIMGIISSFIIHRANIKTDAEVYAGLTGTTIRKRFRQTVEHKQNRFGGIGSGAGAGGGAVEDVEENRVTPTEIQDLNIGQMIYINTAMHRLEHIQVIPEDEALAFAPHKQVAKHVDFVSEAAVNPLSVELSAPSKPTLTKEDYMDLNTEVTKTRNAPSLVKEEPAVVVSAFNNKGEIVEIETEKVMTPKDFKFLRSFFSNTEGLDNLEKSADFSEPVTPQPLVKQTVAEAVKPVSPFNPKPNPFKPKTLSVDTEISRKPISIPTKRPSLIDVPSLNAGTKKGSTRDKDEFEF